MVLYFVRTLFIILYCTVVLYCIIHGYLPASFNDHGSLNDLSWSHIRKSLWSGCTNCSGGGGGRGSRGEHTTKYTTQTLTVCIEGDHLIFIIIIFAGNECHFSSCLGSLKGILDLFVCASQLNNTIMVFILLCLSVKFFHYSPSPHLAGLSQGVNSNGFWSNPKVFQNIDAKKVSWWRRIQEARQLCSRI